MLSPHLPRNKKKEKKRQAICLVDAQLPKKKLKIYQIKSYKLNQPKLFDKDKIFGSANNPPSS